MLVKDAEFPSPGFASQLLFSGRAQHIGGPCVDNFESPSLHLLSHRLPQPLNMGKTTFTLAGREWPKITWWRTKYMRSLYLFLWAAMLTSATNGKAPIEFGYLSICF